ncbi:MAG: hypothetical protein ACFFE5_05040 [Candidatus Thorarchaeota archaeon]
MPRRKDNLVPEHRSKFIDILKKILFYPIFIIIILIFIFNQILAICLAGFFFLAYLFSYLITLSSKKKILALMQEYPLVNDTEISEKLNRPVEDIRRILSSLSKNQKKKKWLIVFLNKRYIFLNENGVENFKQAYSLGYNEKKILEILQPKMNIRSRAEVKAIETTLTNNNRLND